MSVEDRYAYSPELYRLSGLEHGHTAQQVDEIYAAAQETNKIPDVLVADAADNFQFCPNLKLTKEFGYTFALLAVLSLTTGSTFAADSSIIAPGAKLEKTRPLSMFQRRVPLSIYGNDPYALAFHQVAAEHLVQSLVADVAIGQGDVIGATG